MITYRHHKRNGRERLLPLRAEVIVNPLKNEFIESCSSKLQKPQVKILVSNLNLLSPLINSNIVKLA